MFMRWFPTKHGDACEFRLLFPSSITVNVDEFGVATENGPGVPRTITRFSIPPLQGFDMAYQDLKVNGFDSFRYGDKVLIECVEIDKAPEPGPGEKQRSDMPLFTLSVDERD